MANYTPIVKLLKPLETDKYDVNLRNENWQKIDDFFGKLQDNLKKHKEALVLDHPDGSVTTPKLRDKCVTKGKLADDINQMLNDSFVKRAGDTMQGNLTFESGKKVFFNTVNNVTAASIYINVHDNLDIGVNDSVDGAVPLISLCSTNKPQWYNKTVGAKPLATYEELLNEVKKYLPLIGGTLTGNLTFDNSSYIRIKKTASNDYHIIASGGSDNLDIGSKNNTPQANLCCYERPGWYGKDKTTTFKPFLFDDDMVITSGTINDGQTLPIPAGFGADECSYLLSINTVNMTIQKHETLLGQTIKCYIERNKVVCGVNLNLLFTRHYSGGRSDEVDETYTKWVPGTANYVCIARRKV